jgi:hypothetical protein
MTRVEKGITTIIGIASVVCIAMMGTALWYIITHI